MLNILISNFFMIFFTTMTAFSPLFLINVAKYTEQQTALFLFVLGLGIFFWNLVGPMISDHIGRKPALVMFTFISIFIPISVALLYNNFPLLLILTFFLAAGMGYQPLSLAIIPAESVPRPLVASAIAIIVCVGEGIGGSLGPVLSGILADHYGLFSPLWVVAIACAIAFLLSFGIKETAPIKLLKIKEKHGSVETLQSEQGI
ncbi:MFS transporter [Neobacillus drentensis]|uniref:MFS transporter n=1 Tax=Neobacillus drentensis TaxID=220684 RepID=UPI00286B2138|nr:MFS transporter [Neobacillus drentensis]